MNSFIEFYILVGKLKRLQRTGWVVRGVPYPETVADHSWRMTAMAMQKEEDIKRLGADIDKVIEMCLVHDVAEAVIGDIIPEKHQIGDKKISKSEKRELEKNAIIEMSEKYNFPKLKELFIEHEEGQTIEARVVKDLDKVDMLLQAYEYKKMFPNITRLDEFMLNNHADVKLPFFKEIVQEIKSRQEGNAPKANNFIDIQEACGCYKHIKSSTSSSHAAGDFRTGIIILHLEPALRKQNFDTAKMIKYVVGGNMLDYKDIGNKELIKVCAMRSIEYSLQSNEYFYPASKLRRSINKNLEKEITSKIINDYFTKQI